MPKLKTPDNLQIELGKKIKELRKSKKISRFDFANKCKFEILYLEKIETGKANLHLSTVFKIAKLLEVKIADLMPY